MYFDPKLSPDGRRAAVIVVGGNGGDVWVYDFMRKTFTRLTFGGSRRTPGWSRDGSTLYYGARATDRNLNQLVRKPADGSGEEEVITAVQGQLFIRDVLDDQQRVLADYSRNANKQDIGMLPFAKEAKYVPLVTTSFDDYSPSLSPDRRWIAYQSDETSRYEIYVRPASGTGGRWQISTEGGEEPRWSPDGRELYFRNDTRMMVARVEPGATFQNDAPRVLFDGIYNLRSESGVSYDVDAKGRFLMVRLAQDNAPASAVRMILNWTTALQRTMTGSR
jgi:serine/threonine-protein kinase